jgi:hypothetical protein
VASESWGGRQQERAERAESARERGRAREGERA